jgi:hypothetical protein
MKGVMMARHVREDAREVIKGTRQTYTQLRKRFKLSRLDAFLLANPVRRLKNPRFILIMFLVVLLTANIVVILLMLLFD